MVLDKRKAERIIYYNGDNKQEVIDFFISEPNKNIGSKIKIIDGRLHYNSNEYYSERSVIRPNNYILFRYDEDSWWYCNHISKEEFNENFIELT